MKSKHGGLSFLLASVSISILFLLRCVNGGDSVIHLKFTEGTDFEAVPSPDGGQIALQLWSGIWILDVSGGKARQVTDPTNPADEHSNPSWSPDGRYIAYSSLLSDGGIFIVPAGGGQARRLTDTEFDSNPTWSPNGESIAFSRYTSSQGQGIWVVPSTGGASHRITPSEINAQQPSWSPDGELIAFSSDGRLYVMKPDSTSIRKVTDGPGDQLPSWTSDGSELLFLSERSGSLQVWSIPVGGGKGQQVTNEAELYSHAPRWLASQKKIMYTSQGAIRLILPDSSSSSVIPFHAHLKLRHNGYQRRSPSIPTAGVSLAMRGFTKPAITTSGVIVVAAGGDLWSIQTDGRVEQLTSGPADDGEPAWSPTADRIAFISNRTGDYQVWVLNLLTHVIEQVTNDLGYCETPLWHPSGSSIVFVHSQQPESGGVLKVVNLADRRVRNIVEKKGMGLQPLGWESIDGDLVYTGIEYNTDLHTILRRVPLDGSSPRDIPAIPVRQAEFVALAPDADFVAYVSNGELWIKSLRDDRPARRVSMGPAFFPAWETGKRILFSSGDNLRRIDVDRMEEDSLPAQLTWKVPDAAGSIFLRNVRLLDPKPHKGLWDVKICDGRIASIKHAGSKQRAGSVSKELYLNGRTLMPGLMDLHAHMFRGQIPFEGYLYWGVTSIGGAGEQGNWVVQQKQAIDGGTREGPRIFPAGGFVVPPYMNAFPQFFRVANQQQLDRYMDYLVRLGATHVKSYLRMDPWLQAATIHTAHEHGLPVLSHFLTPGIVAAGLDRKEHADFYSNDGSIGLRFRQDVLEILSKTGITLDPTLVTSFVQYTENGLLQMKEALNRPDVTAWLAPYMLVFLKNQISQLRSGPEEKGNQRILEAGSANLAAAHAAGIPLVVGTDYMYLGFLAVHWELELLVAAGLTPAEAIAAATRNAAFALGVSDDLGSIRVGALADLIVLDADPLKDISNTQRINMVIKGGRIIDRDTLFRLMLNAKGNQLPDKVLHHGGDSK